MFDAFLVMCYCSAPLPPPPSCSPQPLLPYSLVVACAQAQPFVFPASMSQNNIAATQHAEIAALPFSLGTTPTVAPTHLLP